MNVCNTVIIQDQDAIQTSRNRQRLVTVDITQTTFSKRGEIPLEANKNINPSPREKNSNNMGRSGSNPCSPLSSSVTRDRLEGLSAPRCEVGDAAVSSWACVQDRRDSNQEQSDGGWEWKIPSVDVSGITGVCHRARSANTAQSSRRQQMHKGTWLCVNKALLTNTRQAAGSCLVNPSHGPRHSVSAWQMLTIIIKKHVIYLTSQPMKGTTLLVTLLKINTNPKGTRRAPVPTHWRAGPSLTLSSPVLCHQALHAAFSGRL